ncbi:sugar transferase [candidate division WS5 bacterium]|uniref:Sugar transferase n=1 Tax=candidate division WS5 bacterium TaxID=2093353 RepID=A0A419DBH8_9BACT|nr:MAG: sugar transferase [candidate division WS5 bacterium]
MVKRIFDIFFSFIGLVILSPLFLLVSVFVKLDSKGPVFFRQERVGKDFKEFRIYKFRSMVNESGNEGTKVTVRGDKRVTRFGKLLRRYKIDELPQLINVLKGEMSFVGPRPEVRKYVEMFRTEYKRLLSVRPGITDPASITYSNEESVLASSNNWEEGYLKQVLPEKIKLSLQYIEKRKSILDDLTLIVKTLFKI